MHNIEWVVIDTETTGFAAPIFVVELAAQRMRGWQPEGAPLHCLLNHGTAIPPEASRVHGYTREILDRDGKAPVEVYREFARYVENRPIAAYNLAYDWDDVLLPEWQRLGIAPVGMRGLCMLQLAQRLIDPVPAGNCKLQTLRQYYNLPARGAHTALGDVETVIDLAQQVLQPLAAARQLDDWHALLAFADASWFPARIPFGKFKGRLFREARHDAALRDWLEWLAASSNTRSAEMGNWYLSRLDTDDGSAELFADSGIGALSTGTTLQVFSHPDRARLNGLVEAARARLAELEATYASERHAVSTTQAKLFDLLRPLFQTRDQLRLRLDFRRKFLDTLLFSGEEEAAAVDQEFEYARAQTDANYERAAAESAGRRPLSEDEQTELKTLWRKLVRLFHPDRVMDDEDRRETYQKLTAEINRARDAGDIDRLREIADDPHGFISRQGWSWIELDDMEDIDRLKHLYELLEGQIIALIEALDALHLSKEYELHQLSTAQSDFLVQVAREQSRMLEEEVRTFEAELDRIEQELEALQA